MVRDFPVHLDSHVNPALMVETIDRDGAVVIDQFWPSEMIHALNRDLDDTVETWPCGSSFDDEIMKAAHGPRTKRLSSLLRRSNYFVDFLLDDRIAAVADQFLLPNCGSYLLNTAQLMEIGPGAPQQVPHRDDWNWPGSHRDLCYSLHTITALTEFTSDNGATMLAMGSHAWRDPTRYPAPNEMAACEMKAGSILVYTGQLIHGAGANRTHNERRRAIEMSFALGWLRAEENHFLALDTEFVCGLPHRAQELLGYRAYEHRAPAGRLGLVDYSDPVHALRKQGLLGPDSYEGRAWPHSSHLIQSQTDHLDNEAVRSERENIGWLRGKERYVGPR